METSSATVQTAIAHHQAGRLELAEAQYRAILKVAPRQADVLHNLGVLLIQRQQMQAALTFFKQALEVDANRGEYWTGYIECLLSANLVGEADYALSQAQQRGFQGQIWQNLQQRIQQALQSQAINLRSFKVFPGFTGQQMQTVLIAEVSINSVAILNLSSLATALKQLLDAEFATLSADAATDAQGLTNLLLDSAVILQQQAGFPVFMTGQAEQLPNSNQFHLSLPYHNIPAALESLKWSVQTLNSLINEKVAAPAVALKQGYHALLLQLRQAAQGCFNHNTQHFFYAAQAERIPYLHLADKIYQFGYGKNARRLDSSITDVTPALAVNLAKDKLFCAQLLRQAGFPVPDHAVARDVNAAVQIAEQLGYPVVVKPIDQDKGIGVAAGLKDAAAVCRAFAKAIEYSARVLVEKHIDGDDYRITIIEGTIERVTRRIPAHLVGDGVSTVQQLLNKTNADPRRQPGKQQAISPINIDHETGFLLAEQGLSLTAIPKAGQFVKMARIANVGVGGIPERLNLEAVHPDNLRLALRVAQCLGLDFAGIDFLSPDISQAWHQVSCGICEVNAQPQLGEYADAIKGSRYAAALARILKNTDGRIPIAGIIGETSIADRVAQILYGILLGAGVNAGVSVSQGIWIGAEQVSWKNLGGFAGGRLLLMDRKVEAAIIPTSFTELLQYGSAFDLCDVAALLNPYDEHRAVAGFHSRETVAGLNRHLLQRARKAVILNADYPVCLAQRAFLSAKELILVSASAEQVEVLAYVKANGRAVWPVTVDEQTAICMSHQQVCEYIPLNNKRSGTMLEVVFAVALAWALEIPLARIRSALIALD